MVKNLPAMQETQVQLLGQEDPLEKGMATPFSILAWRIPWTEEDNCFTILCWPLPYINMNRPQAYIRPPSLLNTAPISHPIPRSRLSQSSRFSSLCNTANSHLLSILHMVMYMFPWWSFNSSTLTFPCCVHKFVLYVCISIAALQISSSVSSF